VERASYSWSEAAASDWPADEKPYRPYPKLMVTVRYALEPAALRASGEAVWSATDRIALQAREPATGREWPGHTVLALGRGGFFMRTGVHPSWAEQPPPPRDDRVELLHGELHVDFGHVIPRPGAQQTLEVSATIGPYRSDPVRIDVRP
jgi:hypothetical protein